MLRTNETGAERMTFRKYFNTGSGIRPQEPRRMTDDELRTLDTLLTAGKSGMVSFVTTLPDGTVIDNISGTVTPPSISPTSASTSGDYNGNGHSAGTVVSNPGDGVMLPEVGKPTNDAGLPKGNGISRKNSTPTVPQTPARAPELEQCVEETDAVVASFEESFDDVGDNVALPYGRSLVVQFKKEDHQMGLGFLTAYGESHHVVDKDRRIYQVKPNTHLSHEVYDKLMDCTTFLFAVGDDVKPQLDRETGILYFDSSITPTFARAKRAVIGGMRITQDDLVVQYKNGNTTDLIAEAQDHNVVPRAFDLRAGVAVFGGKSAVSKDSDVLKTDSDKYVLPTQRLGRASKRYQDWSEYQVPVEQYN